MTARPKVVGYLRVSTDRQAEVGHGLDVQRAAIRRWATDHGHNITEWHADEGVSGTLGMDDREGLGAALEAIKAKRASGVVVYRLDRLARDLIVQETLLAEVWRVGGEVFSTSPAEAAYLVEDPSDPTRKLIRQVLGAVAEYERSLIALRLRAGRRRKAEAGGFAYGSPPLGYKAEGGELVPDADEQRVVTRIMELHRSGHSSRQIVDVIHAEGHRSKRGGRFHSATVAAVIRKACGSASGE